MAVRKSTKKKTTKKKTTKKASKKKSVAKKKAAKKSKASKKITKKATKKAAKKVTKKAAKKKTAKKAKKKAATKTTKKVQNKIVEKKPKPKAPKVAPPKPIEPEKVALTEEEIVKKALGELKGFNFFVSDSDECFDPSCDNPITTGGYCRYHYIKHWKDIKKKQFILEEGKMLTHIDVLTKNFSCKIIEPLLSDLSDKKIFYDVLKQVNIETTEESFDDPDGYPSEDVDVTYETKVSNRSTYEE